MYLNTTVKIPVIKGKIITKKKGNVTYILYQYGSEYNQEKQYAVPKRAIVGKVSDDDPTLMFPNEKFQIYFPDAEIPEVLYGDEIRIKQIITNLLTNAVKYTEKGKVWFRININSLNPTEVVLDISVQDTGIGIKAEERNVISRLVHSLHKVKQATQHAVHLQRLGDY